VLLVGVKVRKAVYCEGGRSKSEEVSQRRKRGEKESGKVAFLADIIQVKEKRQERTRKRKIFPRRGRKKRN